MKSPTTDDQILDAIRAGRTTRQINAELGACVKRVRRLAKENNQPLPPPQRPTPTRDAAVALFTSTTLPATEIARRIGTSTDAVLRALRAAGLDPRARRLPDGLVDMVKSGASIDAIRAAFPRVTRPVIRSLREEYGISATRALSYAYPKQIAEIRELAATPATLQSIAARFNRSVNWLHSVARQHGIDLKNRALPVTVEEPVVLRPGEVRHDPRYDWMTPGRPFHVTVNAHGITLPAVGL